MPICIISRCVYTGKNPAGCLPSGKRNRTYSYVPLHSAPAGQKFGRFSGEDVYTTKESERLLRLPMFYNLDMEDVKYITDTIASFEGF